MRGTLLSKGKTHRRHILIAPIDDGDNRAAVTIGGALSVITTCLDSHPHGEPLSLTSLPE